ncbi:hypothetical protein GXN76_02700 [Kroppenstedtia pulmonis]|uniref:Zf-HC2 domain-containing protein n=1 Tax=Kroppenstedtia pulmonis TaxID=1380685 RepID=A0A7D3Y3D1_9BACL|nr:hypothetical protein [Kroppenstedtia pulmonis]QKG83485.1 hypothetical protein GXN76_02700 [Kroppenstedtia pulmonis]
MPCFKAEKLLAFSLKEVSQGEAEIITKHLESCNHCQILWQDIAIMTEAWENPQVQAPAGLVDTVMDSLPQEPESPPIIHSKKRWRPRCSSTGVHFAAASVATLLFAYFDLFQVFPDAIGHISATADLLGQSKFDLDFFFTSN